MGRNTTSVENSGANGDLGVRASFPNLISGIPYTICETQQTGWTNTQPGTIDPTYGEPCETVTLTSSSTVTRYFGNVEPDIYSVRAIKYNDLDGDGTANEVDSSPGGVSGNTLTGWEFIAYDSSGTEVGRNITSVEVAGSGDLGVRATIPGLISGEEYTICEVNQPGWTNSDPGTIDPTYGRPCKDLTLVSNTFTNMLFGNIEPDTYELRLIKYNDLDEDGTNNEVNTAPGSGLSGNALTGWEFVVYDSAGNEVGRNTTSVENPRRPTAISAFAPRFLA